MALKESRATGIARPALGLLVSQVSSAYLVMRKRKALYRKPRDASEPQQASRHDALDDGAALDFCAARGVPNSHPIISVPGRAYYLERHGGCPVD